MKKIIALVLTFATVLAFASCGKKTADTYDSGFILKNENSVELGTPDKSLNPEEVYKKITYTPEMFYGMFSVPGWFTQTGEEESEELVSFKQSAEFMTDPYDTEKKISTLPNCMQAGHESFDMGISLDISHNWLNMKYIDDAGVVVEHQFLYEIEGNKLLLTGVDWTYSNENKELKYSIIDSIKLEYEFSFCGRGLTLSKDGNSVTLYAGKNYNASEDYLSSDMYLSKDSKSIDGIKCLSYYWADGGKTSRLNVVTDAVEEGQFMNTIYTGIAKLTEDGLFTLTVPFKDGTKTYQFVYFLCDEDGIVLTDGTNTYYYQQKYSDYMKFGISNNVSVEQLDELNNFNESQMETISKKTNSLYEDLAAAFKKEGINVTIDKDNGEIAMDASVLFGGDSAEIGNEGKNLLTKFIKAYTSIIYNEKYDGFVEKTIVEGHIAPISNVTYESGLPFSEKRANNVKAFCLSVVDESNKAKLDNDLETLGCSNSKPILDENGKPNLDASRRVSFRFIINIAEN